MRFSSAGGYLARLLHTRLVAPQDAFLTEGAPSHNGLAITAPRRAEWHPAHRMSIYEQSRRAAFLAYPTIPLSLTRVFPSPTQQRTARMALNLAREPITESTAQAGISQPV